MASNSWGDESQGAAMARFDFLIDPGCQFVRERSYR